MTGLVMPDEATALATVAGTTVTSAVILIRRPSPTFVGPDGGGHASQDK
ncbi:hypothetical protein [Streptomyces naganishii]|nr:hypothetical protein [Streptomyces naganishii]